MVVVVWVGSGGNWLVWVGLGMGELWGVGFRGWGVGGGDGANGVGVWE